MGDGCNGGDISSPWDFIKKGVVTGGQYKGTGPFGAGLCSDFSMPHCHHHGPQGHDPSPAEGAPGCPHQTSATCPTKCDSSAQAPHDRRGGRWARRAHRWLGSGEWPEVLEGCELLEPALGGERL